MVLTTNPKELKIWNEAYEFTKEMYIIIAMLPKREEHNLVSQMRRSALSILLNIAEGAASEFIKTVFSHLSYSYASAKELETCLLLCKDFSYIDEETYTKTQEKMNKLIGMIYMFKKSIQDRELENKNSYKKKIAEEIRQEFMEMF